MTSGFTQLSNSLKRRKIRHAKACDYTDTLRDALEGSAEATDKPVYHIRPYREDGGIRQSVPLLRQLHKVGARFVLPDKAEEHSWEMWFNQWDERTQRRDGILSLNMIPGTPKTGRMLRDQLYEDYPNSDITQRPNKTPTIPPDAKIAGARMGLFQSAHYPIRHVDADGFSDGGESTRRGKRQLRDPYKNVMTKVTASDATVMLQVILKPVSDSSLTALWNQMSMHRTAKGLESGQPYLLWTRDPTDAEEEAADLIRDQIRESAFSTDIRIFAAADTDAEATDAVREVTESLSEYYESSLAQGLYGKPVGGRFGSKRKMKSFLKNVGARKGDFAPIANPRMTDSELAGLVHLPEDNVQNPSLDWTTTTSGKPVPQGTPRFNFEAAGLTEDADLHEKQIAMMTANDPTDATYVGFGARKGTEVGYPKGTLNTHAFVGGSTGGGKTTTGKHLFYQAVDAGEGAMFYDPKGMDAKDLVGLVPERRRDDIIFLEIGSDRDKQVGFNFMEVPGNAPPGTSAYSAALESMADDLEAVLSLAAGDGDNSWGTRMSRVTRNVCRGFGKVDRPLTMLDMYYALESEAGRGRYASLLTDERIEWIEDYANNHLAEMPDEDIEPLIGRLQQFIESDLVRELVSIPSQDAFSIDDAVRDGKIIIVRDKSSSDTAGVQTATALMRRIWVSIRELTLDDNETNPPEFTILADEFNEIATEESNVAQMLEDARSFGLKVVAFCQDLSGQLDGDVLTAIEGQCNTFISYNPGREKDAKLISAQHSEDIGVQELMDLPKYTFFTRMESTDYNERTHSFKVNAFPPIEEICEDIGSDEDEIEARIERSLDLFGASRATSEEMRSRSVFAPGGKKTNKDGELTAVSNEHRNHMVAKAIYDESIRRAGTKAGDWVPLEDAGDRIRTYAKGLAHDPDADLSTTSKLWSHLIEHTNDDYVGKRHEDGDVVVRATSHAITEFLKTGINQTSGGPDSWLVGRDAYVPLTELGFRFTIPQQDGTDMGDAVATLDDVLQPIPTGAKPKEIAKRVNEFEREYPLLARISGASDVRVEIECSTGRSKMAQTFEHIADAKNDDQNCLLIGREKAISNLNRALFDGKQMARDHDNGAWYYNTTKQLRIDGQTMYRKGDGNSEWIRRPDGRLILNDSNGTTHAEFDSVYDLYEDKSHYYTSDELDEDERTTLYKPFIPEYYIDVSVEVTRDDVTLVEIPENAEHKEDLVEHTDDGPNPLVGDDKDSKPKAKPAVDDAFGFGQ